MIASEKASKSLTGILSSFLVLLLYSTLTAFPINNILSANESGKYEVGSIDTLKVKPEFHSSLLLSSD